MPDNIEKYTSGTWHIVIFLLFYENLSFTKKIYISVTITSA